MDRKTEDRNLEVTQQFDASGNADQTSTAGAAARDEQATSGDENQSSGSDVSDTSLPIDVTISHTDWSDSDPSGSQPGERAAVQRPEQPTRTDDGASRGKAAPQENEPAPDSDEDAHPRFGRFLLLELLSEGAKGEVYRALHSRLHKHVALRILPSAATHGKAAQANFQNTIRMIGGLSHPNLARLENAGQEDGKPYLVTEYVPGLDFEGLVQRVGPLAVPEACQLIGQALLGLAHLQEQGIVHGDLAPTRLRLSSAGGAVKITDIGLSRLVDTTIETGQGDPEQDDKQTAYRAPELIQEGTRPDLCADIYALGCTLHYLIAGEHPVTTEKEKTNTKNSGQSLPRLAMHRSDVPYGLQQLVDRMTATNPQQRLQRPLEIAGLLSAFAAGCDLMALLEQARLTMQPSAARSDSSIHSAEYLAGQVPRNPQTAARRWLVAAVLLLAVGGLAASSPLLINYLNGQHEQAGLQDDEQPADNGSSPANDASPALAVEWDAPPQILEEPPDAGVTDQYNLIRALDSRRDSFSMQLEADSEHVEISSLDGRGIVQVPVTLTSPYKLTARVERVSGDNSFGIGVPLATGMLIALIDHKEGDQWISGLAYFGSNAKLHFIEPHEGQLLAAGQRLELHIDVSQDEVCFQVFDASSGGLPMDSAPGSELPATATSASSDAATVRSPRLIAYWRGEPAKPQLARFTSYYHGAALLHAYQSAFRISSLHASDAAGPLKPISFADQSATAERRLAERLLWRGATLSLFESTSAVTSFKDLPAEPWIESVDARSGAPSLAIDDQDVIQIAAIQGMKRLDLRGTAITGEALAAINGMSSLEFLALGDDILTGEDLLQLRDLPQLKKIMLNGMDHVQNDALAFLHRFPDLTYLCLSQCPITDQGVIDHIPRLSQLEHLCLNYTHVQGDFLEHLKSLKHLKELQLGSTQISDLDLEAIGQLEHLTKLVLSGSRVSRLALQAFQLRFSNLKVN